MNEPEESKYLEEIEQKFKLELLIENIETIESIKETFPNDLESFYLDSEGKVEAHAYKLLPQDSRKVYTIPTEADYIVLSPYGATIFKLYNETNPEDIGNTGKYNPSDLTNIGLSTITKHIIKYSEGKVIAPTIKQENEKEEEFRVVGVNLSNLFELYCSGHPYLRFIDDGDRKKGEKRNNKQRKLQKVLSKLRK